MARGKEGGERESGGEASLPTREIGGDLVATRTNEEDVDRPRRDGRDGRTDGRTDGWVVRRVEESLAQIIRSTSPTQKGQKRRDMRGILHDEDESAPRQRFIVMASHSFNDIAWLQEAR